MLTNKDKSNEVVAEIDKGFIELSKYSLKAAEKKPKKSSLQKGQEEE